MLRIFRYFTLPIHRDQKTCMLQDTKKIQWIVSCVFISQSKIRSNSAPEEPQINRESIQLAGHLNAIMRYEPHFLAHNKWQNNTKSVSQRMWLCHILIFVVLALCDDLIVCVLWSRTLKRSESSIRDWDPLLQKHKGSRRPGYDTYTIIHDECVLGEQERNNDATDDSVTWCVLQIKTDRQTDLLSRVLNISVTSTWIHFQNIPTWVTCNTRGDIPQCAILTCSSHKVHKMSVWGEGRVFTSVHSFTYLIYKIPDPISIKFSIGKGIQ